MDRLGAESYISSGKKLFLASFSEGFGATILLVIFGYYKSQKLMEADELKKLRELFHITINNVEMEYSFYFCLNSIQKGLSRIESIYDHFKLDQETLEFRFKLDSDLPAELKEIISNTYHRIFLEEKTS
ncbi:MAG TPA: hypothetical protein VGC08_11795 [Pedobacter sp.]|jgi:hypothetical protein